MPTCRLLLLPALGFILGFSITAAAANPKHPLDPLEADEIRAAVAILRSDGRLTEDSRFVMLTAQEPPKSQVLTYKTGSAFAREAFAILYQREARRTFEAVVNLTENRVISWIERKNVQPPLLIEDMVLTDQIVRADPRWQAAMGKRGIRDLDKVEVVPWTAGYHGDASEQGRRVVRAISSYRGNSKTSFTSPIEGVVAYVDLTARKVTGVLDTGVLPLPPPDPDLDKSARSTLPPLQIVQPEGSGFVVEGNEVRWGDWRFRFSFHPRDGLVLYTVGLMDHSRLRSVLYRASLSDMVVPYGDPSPAWFFRNVFDTGEYAFVGHAFFPRTLGVDTPENSVLLDAEFADEQGNPYRIAKAASIYERDAGLLWRYSDLQHNIAETRRARELVVSSIMNAGNYEYGFNWVFHEDGVLEMELLLTGIMTAKGIEAGHDFNHFGHRVTDYIEAIHHQHFFNFRIDMDVDGSENSVVELNTMPAQVSKKDPYGKAFVTDEKLLKTETEAKRQVDFASGRKWMVINPNQKNSLNEPVGYMLVPGENAVPYAAPTSWIRKRAGFLNYHFWVTPQAQEEMNAAGTYINQSSGGDGLPAWTRANRSIQQRDIVLWYTLGITHLPRPEEWPVMSIHRAGFRLVPSGFFTKNPSVDHP